MIGYRFNGIFWGLENMEFYRVIEIYGELLLEKVLYVLGNYLFLKVLYIDVFW